MHKKHKHDLIVILAMVGLGVSLYLAITKALGYAVSCDITHGCGEVLGSKYSSFLGVPLAQWGVLYFSGVTITALLANHYAFWRKVLTIYLGIGAVLSLGFLSLQFFVIKKVCQYCLTTDIISIFLFLWDLNVEHRKD
jgi:uncharacterized membrane protein